MTHLLFDLGADLIINEDSPQIVNGFLTNTSPGPVNEVGQALVVQVVSNNPGLFTIAPTFDAAGNLTFTPTSAANGIATVEVTLTDDGGTANGGQNSLTKSFSINFNAGAQVAATPPPSTNEVVYKIVCKS